MCASSALLMSLGTFLLILFTLLPIEVQQMFPPDLLPVPSFEEAQPVQPEEAVSGYESTYAYLTFSQNPIQIGDEVIVSLSLVNTGTLAAGIPSFTLYLESDALELVSTPDNGGVLYGAVAAGSTYTMQWTYRAASTGTAEFSGRVSYEVHEGYPGPAYWSGTSAGPEVLVIE
ncbi:MAG: hypothetical protein H6673_08210 [Anaerolineales bacterium]|nr:hypothetical protein [Anaerolineales bacterium]